MEKFKNYKVFHEENLVQIKPLNKNKPVIDIDKLCKAWKDMKYAKSIVR